MCRNFNCEACGPFEEHHCRKCNRSNVAHRSANCTKSLVDGGGRVLCRVKGCDECDVGKRHHCRECGDRDSTHRSANCPYRQRIVLQPVFIQGYGYVCVEIRR